MRHFISFLIFLSPLALFSQTQHQGILVTYKGDTIAGSIHIDHAVSSMGNQVIVSDSVKTRKFWARDIEYVDCDHGAYYYHTYGMETASGEVPVLLPRLISGQLELFAFAFKGGPANLITTQHYYYVKTEYSTQKVTKKNFKRIMSTIVEADPELANKIKNEELGFRDMKQVILTYNSRPHTLPAE